MDKHDYVSNSHKSKAQKDRDISEKSLEKVIEGQAKIQKKSGIRKVADSFISEDADGVVSYVFTEVLLPAAKKAISDAVKTGIDMIMYGESGKRNAHETTSDKSYHSAYRRQSRATLGFDYDDILFETRGDAEVVLDTLCEIIDNYDFVSVSDLYDIAHVRCDNYNANKYGWTDISTGRSVRVRDGYVLKLPRPLPLD